MTWKLQAITGELEGQEVTIDRDMLVGRHQDADLLLQAAEISRRHAAFLLKEDALWVQDLKSSNGTFVNDIRIDQDKLLMDGDIVQFASVKFNVLAPVKHVVLQTEQAAPEVEVQPVVASVETPVQQPAEAVATAEIKPAAPVERTVADQMNEQGMPELSERDSSVQINREGIPSGVAIPKPAPIPEGVDIHAATQPKVEQVKAPELVAEEHVETQKNAKLGLATLVILIILAIIAWLLFK